MIITRLPGLTRYLRSHALNSGLLLPLVLLGLWQVIDSQAGCQIPRVSDLILTLQTLVAHGTFINDVAASCLRMLAGFTGGAVAGLCIGILTGAFRPLKMIFGPAVSMWRQVPLFSLIPLLTLWFGLGEEAKVILIALATSVPVTLNAYEGICNIPRKYMEVTEVFQLGPLARLRFLDLPAALPFLLTGLRQGMAFAWVATIVSELFLAAAPGLGEIITAGQEQLRADMIIIGIFMIALIGIGFNALVSALIHQVSPAMRTKDRQDQLS